MVIIMAGLPKSGKTYIVKIFKALLPSYDIQIIEPSKFIPPEADKNVAATAAWQIAFEKLLGIIGEGNKNNIIVFDSCASKSSVVVDISTKAKISDHDVWMVFVFASKETCLRRSNHEVDKELIDKYERLFLDTLKRSQAACNRFFVVDNDRDPDLQTLHKLANKIVASLKDGNDRIH